MKVLDSANSTDCLSKGFFIVHGYPKHVLVSISPEPRKEFRENTNDKETEPFIGRV